MNISYKQRLFIYFFLLLSLFTATTYFFGSAKERSNKTKALEGKLDAFASVIYKGLDYSSNAPHLPQNIQNTLPTNLRISLIDSEGGVLFDSVIDSIHENHLEREEILGAKQHNTGSDIRVSATNGKEYLYFARKYPHFYIRVAIPYDLELQKKLTVDNIYTLFTFVLSLLTLLIAYTMANRFGKSINRLKDFALNPAPNINTYSKIPNDELGIVAKRLIKNYEDLNRGKQKIALEREKLLQHIQSSDEGICFFNKARKVQFYNGLFIHHLNIILEHKSTDPSIIFSDKTFEAVHNFLNSPHNNCFFETEIKTEANHFSLRINIFDDDSFDIILIDVTKLIKTRLLKQEMTSNIAHELRTPITSIRGYLETLVETDMPIEQIKKFIKKAYQQSLNLNQLVEDMSIITRIDESVNDFDKQPINIKASLEEVKENLTDELKKQEIALYTTIPDPCIIRANRSLIYSIFKNLIENSIKHGGHKAHIHINCYNEDPDFYYFSYSDEGVGIEDESHLNRLFERFYRVSEGRTRKTGGTGLGLAIVKNAILNHKGSITAKKRKDGKLEFLFKLKKN